ncbi:MAG: hypothetical protein R8N23_04520 [Reichenbachiella sp.]|uniref:hypothetical protein n=1 Tax=Reichenbachiella sp. TaxID=2184521 RepID=UPI0029669098|nr:hypothetical protein [Reichenbachiella sp.]MDW3209090.1 hypothetical protein [Reichenbachiella sp.]MDW3209106.1 hypothetical protein [Reichenbachiella sp.]
MKNHITLIFLSILLCGCSGGYPELGNGYKIVGEGGYETAVVNPENTVMISGYILDYATDSDFILISQSPSDSLPPMNFLLYTDSDREEIAMDNTIYRTYWIIVKNQPNKYSYDSTTQFATYSNVHGPFNKLEYRNLRSRLNVSNDLKLLNE